MKRGQGIPFPVKFAAREGPKDRSSMEMRIHGAVGSRQADQNRQKSAYLHKPAWQWTKIVDKDYTLFRITFYRSAVTDAAVVDRRRGGRRGGEAVRVAET